MPLLQVVMLLAVMRLVKIVVYIGLDKSFFVYSMASSGSFSVDSEASNSA